MTVTANVVGYAYPWDVLGDPGFADRVRRLGVTTVAVAAAYHTTRAATPFHPFRRLVNARSSALYRPVRAEAWDDRRLVPAKAEWVDDPDPFGNAAALLADAGLEVAAWTVLTHSTRLGDANPDLAVVNCFDEPYPYALCPQSEEVREYAATLAAEALRGTPSSAIVLEACGQLGVQHGGHHEKTDGAYDDRTRRLLSICCCSACRKAWTDRGLDANAVIADLRAATSPGATSQPSPDRLQTLLEVRQTATDALRADAIRAARTAGGQSLQIILHAQPDPWETGALPGLTPAAPGDADAVVAQCWATGASSVQNAGRLTEAVAGRATPGAYVTALPPTKAEEFAHHVSALRDAGVEQFHLYHLGLAGPDRLPMLAEASRVAVGTS